MREKVVLITGASSGLGLATALYLSEKGFNVFGTSRDPNKFKDAKKVDKISYSEYLSKNLKVIDSAAVSIARENTIPIRIFSILKNNCFKNVYYNKELNDTKSVSYKKFERYFIDFYNFCFDISLDNMIREIVKFKK